MGDLLVRKRLKTTELQKVNLAASERGEAQAHVMYCNSELAL